MGVDEASGPFTPFMHVPVLVVIPSIRKMPIVVDDTRLEVRDGITLTATFDHRYKTRIQAHSQAHNH